MILISAAINRGMNPWTQPALAQQSKLVGLGNALNETTYCVVDLHVSIVDVHVHPFMDTIYPFF